MHRTKTSLCIFSSSRSDRFAQQAVAILVHSFVDAASTCAVENIRRLWMMVAHQFALTSPHAAQSRITASQALAAQCDRLPIHRLFPCTSTFAVENRMHRVAGPLCNFSSSRSDRFAQQAVAILFHSFVSATSTCAVENMRCFRLAITSRCTITHQRVATSCSSVR